MSIDPYEALAVVAAVAAALAVVATFIPALSNPRRLFKPSPTPFDNQPLPDLTKILEVWGEEPVRTLVIDRKARKDLHGALRDLARWRATAVHRASSQIELSKLLPLRSQWSAPAEGGVVFDRPGLDALVRSTRQTLDETSHGLQGLWDAAPGAYWATADFHQVSHQLSDALASARQELDRPDGANPPRVADALSTVIASVVQLLPILGRAAHPPDH